MDGIIAKFLPYLLIYAGLYSLVNVFLNRDAFYRNHKVQRMVRLLGRTGTRAFYFVFGAVLTAGGIFAAVTGLFDKAA